MLVYCCLFVHETLVRTVGFIWLVLAVLGGILEHTNSRVYFGLLVVLLDFMSVLY